MPARNILIADDDQDACVLVRETIAALGFSVHTAMSGPEALDLFKQVSPDLAVLDMCMPGLTGSEVCREIKTTYQGEHVPVLILTAKDGIKDKVEALEGGADDYLTKPFHYKELQARVKALLRVRDLNLKLVEQNEQLRSMQEKLVEQERKLVAMQLAGTAAHNLGQPLAAITLNAYLLEKLKPEDERYQTALAAIKNDSKRMGDILEKLRSLNSTQTAEYYSDTKILELDKK
jgi:DNA-binding response OmpR family regulator